MSFRELDNLPPEPHMPENRIEQTTAATAANAAPEASPTGVALLPPKAVPYVVTAVGLATIVVAAPTFGLPFVIPAAAIGISQLIIALGVLFGIASPGLRKK